MKIAVDAMGGDHGPKVIVEGAVLAAREMPHGVILVGHEEKVRKELSCHKRVPSNIEVHHAEDVIDMHESAAQSVRRKKDASVCVAALVLAFRIWM